MSRLARLFALLVLCGGLALAIAAIWVMPSPRAPRPALPPLIGSIDLIVVEKARRRMTLFQNGAEVRSYSVALGFSPSGDKERQGDGRTPEGRYRIDRRNAASAYHLSLGIDYPQAEDRARALTAGYDPGGDIFIHGQPNALPDLMKVRGDWTAGCIALTNAEMREIWDAVPIGTPVEITP